MAKRAVVGCDEAIPAVPASAGARARPTALADREHVLREVAVAAARHDDFDSAAGDVLAVLTGPHGGWDVAHMMLVEPGTGQLRTSGVWSFRHDDDRFAALVVASGGRGSLVTVVAHVRKVMASDARVFWCADMQRLQPTPTRIDAFTTCGVRTGAFVPVLVDGDVVAALELFRSDGVLPDPATLEMLRTVGTVLGRVVERERASVTTAAVVSRMMSVTDSAPEAIVSLDVDGVVVGWNTSAQLLLGWGQQDVVGRSLSDLVAPGAGDRSATEFVNLARTASRCCSTEPARVGPVPLTMQHAAGHVVGVDAYATSWDDGGATFFSLFLLDRTARDTAERLRRERDASLLAQRHAVELNDTVVQGLAVALYALEGGDTAQATAAVRDTLATARSLVSSLLDASDRSVVAGLLRRAEPADPCSVSSSAP